MARGCSVGTRAARTGRRRFGRILATLLLLAAASLTTPRTSPAREGHAAIRPSAASSGGAEIPRAVIPDARRVAEAWVCADRLSGHFVVVMIRVAQYLDRISRNVPGLVSRLERLAARGDLREMRGALAELGEWIGSLPELACSR